MNGLYLFLAGPGVWLSAAICMVGLLAKAAFLLGLSRERDRVFWDHVNPGWGTRSVLHWLLPFGSVSLQQNPVFAGAIFLFHLCLLAAPIFLVAHNLLVEEALGFSLPTLPDQLADAGAILVVASGVFLLVRRLARPEVRLLTTPGDHVLLLLTLAPFLTGLACFHQWGDYRTWMVLHMLSAEVLLVLIPFTKLSHVLLFFFSRFFIGSEMGGRRAVEGRLGARVW